MPYIKYYRRKRLKKKSCTKCKDTLSADLFNLDRSKKDGLSSTCKPCNKKRSTTWYSKNKERVYNNTLKWRKQNKERYLENSRRYQRSRYSECMENDLYRCAKNFRVRLANAWAGRKRSRRSLDILGLPTWEAFYTHLVTSALERYGFYLDLPGEYHIDHIKPLCLASDLDDLERLNHHSNLQLLTPYDNLVKGSSYAEEK